MQRSESAFLREISYICEVPDSEQLAVVGIALSERNDISEDELIQLILDADSAYYLRRIAVESYATALANEHIGYVFATPIRYSISSIATDKYPISDIVAIRCDGFVEYAYEYNDIRVYGDDTYWNISKAGDSYTDEHGGFQLTPRIQANEYMVRLGNL